MKLIRILALALVAIAVLSIAGCGPKVSPSVGVYVPSSALTVPAWFIDPQNTSGCASDSNTGQSATCTGGTNGPLLTWFALNALYWNCTGQMQCPRLRQNTTITFLSSHVDNTDPVYFRPAIENGALVQIVGNLGTSQVIAGGSAVTLGTVTAKNRATPALLSATAIGTLANLAAGQFVVNATHPSRAWITAVASNAPTFSEPLTQVVIPSAGSAVPTETDTWATSDVVTVYQPLSVNLVAITPTVADIGTNNTWVYVVNVNGFDPSSGNRLTVMGPARFLESSVRRNVDIVDPMSLTAGDFNDYFASAVELQTAALRIYYGGAIAGVLRGNSPFLDGDIVTGAVNITAGPQNGLPGLGLVYTSGTLFMAGGPIDVRAIAAYSGSAIVWGPGGISVTGNARLRYTAGAGLAATTFKLTGSYNINSQSLYCTLFPSSSTITCNNTLTAANLDTSLGATSGCATGGGANICNYGP